MLFCSFFGKHNRVGLRLERTSYDVSRNILFILLNIFFIIYLWDMKFHRSGRNWITGNGNAYICHNYRFVSLRERFCLKINVTFHFLACACMSCTGYVNVILNRRNLQSQVGLIVRQWYIRNFLTLNVGRCFFRKWKWDLLFRRRIGIFCAFAFFFFSLFFVLFSFFSTSMTWSSLNHARWCV